MDPAPSKPGDAAAQAAWLARNAVDSLPEGGLAHKLALGRPLRVKLGIDPTAPDIHLGFTVVLQKLREFQEFGHTVVLIIGDYTARVGDPSGRSVTRPMIDVAEIDANATTFQEQALKVLDPERLEVRFNSEWLDMSMSELFALLRTTTVAQLLERDDFAKRFAAREPISCTRCCKGSIRSRSTPTSSWEGQTRSSTCCSGATFSAPTVSRSR
jgi:tyrosyl-tRNA synthetase